MARRPTDLSRRPKYGWTDFGMPGLILAALTLIFLVGITIVIRSSAFKADTIDSASDVVAILAPALAAVGTVAAGVFGYTLGARGASEAQQAASEATQQANETRAEAVADIADTEALAHVVDRIANTAIRGQPSPEGKRLLSGDDLNTLVDASRTARAKRTRRTAASE